MEQKIRLVLIILDQFHTYGISGSYIIIGQLIGYGISGKDNQNQSGLGPGNYTLNITDSNGNQTTGQFILLTKMRLL